MEKHRSFKQQDIQILESYKVITEGLADYLGAGYELVLHNLESLDNSAIAIYNGEYSGRKLGAPITDLALQMLSEINKSGGKNYISYFSTNKDGHPLKSTTIAIRGINNKVIGLLCINMYLDTPYSEFLKNVSGGIQAKQQSTPASEEFTANVDELLLTVLNNAKNQVISDDNIPSVNKNKEIIAMLYQLNVFSLKNSVQIVAKNLKISKNTVYMHIRAIKDGK